MAEETGRVESYRYGVCVGLDAVGFSTKPPSEQDQLIEDLENQVVGCLAKDSLEERADYALAPAGDGLFVAFLRDKDPDGNLRRAFTFIEALYKARNGFAKLRLGVASGLMRPRYAFTSGKPAGPANVIGDGVNLTSRVLGVADEEQILVSEGVYYHSRVISDAAKDLTFVPVGDYRIKHGDLLRLYAVFGPKDEGKQLGLNKSGRFVIPKSPDRIDWAADPKATMPVFGPARPLDDLRPLGSPGHGELDSNASDDQHLNEPQHYKAGEREPFLVAEAWATLRQPLDRLEVTIRIPPTPRVAVSGTERNCLEKGADTPGHPAALAVEALARGLRGELSGPVRHSAGAAS
jgi:class 3 adenylate cyclase